MFAPFIKKNDKTSSLNGVLTKEDWLPSEE